MLGGILVMGGLGVFIGVGLALASKIFYVYVDPKIEAVDEALPGANCGGCGYPGCTANAVAIVEGNSPPSSCVAAPAETGEEIAAIMGHEIAHALREHSRERASVETTKNIFFTVVGTAIGAGRTTQALAEVFVATTLSLPNSRAHETESDRIGVELMARAGYDPRSAIRVWQKMAQATGGESAPEFMSTHPSAATRIKDLTNYAQKVMPLYRQASR